MKNRVIFICKFDMEIALYELNHNFCTYINKTLINIGTKVHLDLLSL